MKKLEIKKIKQDILDGKLSIVFNLPKDFICENSNALFYAVAMAKVKEEEILPALSFLRKTMFSHQQELEKNKTV